MKTNILKKSTKGSMLMSIDGFVIDEAKIKIMSFCDTYFDF